MGVDSPSSLSSLSMVLMRWAKGIFSLSSSSSPSSSSNSMEMMVRGRDGVVGMTPPGKEEEENGVDGMAAEDGKAGGGIDG